MKLLAAMLAVITSASAWLQAQNKPADDYPLTEDSKPHDAVPRGELLKFTLDRSDVFPGTTRNVTVYVPRQYDPRKPACVWVNQDGVQNNAPVVFDNLIAKGDMPVTIYIAASPGVVKALDGKVALDRFNRSFEYDGLGDAYARFVIGELLPFVEKQKTTDGRAIVLSKSGNDRCIGGSSSGAVCAFTAAWERPDAFRRVFSSIGTYVSLRGADRYPGLIRKFEPKPLRIFLQDGDRDLNIYGGDWWMANQMMERALTFADYEVNHAWGTGGHDAKQSAAIFPDAVRWLWKDWPKEPQAGAGSPQLKEILLPGEKWERVKDGRNLVSDVSSNEKGEVVFAEGVSSGDSTRWKVGLDGKINEVSDRNKADAAAKFGPEGSRYQREIFGRGIKAWDSEGKQKIVAENILVRDFAVRHDMSIFATERYLASVIPTRVWFIPPDGAKRITGHALGFHASSLTFSPDQSLLYLGDSSSHWVWSFQILPDGSLKHGQPFYDLHVPDTEDNASIEGMVVDGDGRLYVATNMGIQVCDQAGRVNCIIPTPNGEVSGLAFGGANFDTVFATCGDKVFKRKLKVRGAPSFLPPVKPSAPRL